MRFTKHCIRVSSYEESQRVQEKLISHGCAWNIKQNTDGAFYPNRAWEVQPFPVDGWIFIDFGWMTHGSYNNFPSELLNQYVKIEIKDLFPQEEKVISQDDLVCKVAKDLGKEVTKIDSETGQFLGGSVPEDTLLEGWMSTQEKALKADQSTGAVSPVGDVNSDARGSGARYNANKPDYSLIPLSTLESEAKVWAFGAAKYKAWNWIKGMAWSVPYASLMRHMAAWQRGEEIDPESGESHLAHAMCNLRMLEYYRTYYKEGDDRPKQFFNLEVNNDCI